MSAAYDVPDVPRKSWFARNWWWFIPLLILLPLLLCGGACAGLFGFALNQYGEMPETKGVVEKINQNAACQEALGSPIELPSIFESQPNIQQDNDGTRNLRYKVKGPKGTADVEVESEQSGADVKILKVIVTPETGEPITVVDVAAEGGAGEGDAGSGEAGAGDAGEAEPAPSGDGASEDATAPAESN